MGLKRSCSLWRSGHLVSWRIFSASPLKILVSNYTYALFSLFRIWSSVDHPQAQLRNILTTLSSGVMGSRRLVMFWDADNCKLPKKYDGKGLLDNIVRGLQIGGIQCENDPYHFQTYMVGNMDDFNEEKKLLAQASGHIIEMNIPSDFKGASDQALIARVYEWMHRGGRSPSNVLLVTGDQDFSSVVVDLRGHGHTVIVASVLKSVSPILCWAAHHVLDWMKLSEHGEYLLDTHPARQPRMPMTVSRPRSPPPAVAGLNPTDWNVYVWWDYNTCPVPRGFHSKSKRTGVDKSVVNSHMQISSVMQNTLQSLNLRGPVRIFVYGSSESIPSALRIAFENSNITLRHVEEGRKNTPCVTMVREILGVFKTCPSSNAHVIITNENVKWAVNVLKNDNVVVVAKDEEGVEYDDDVWIWKWSDLLGRCEPEGPKPWCTIS